MRRGGNAVDAAVTCAFVQGVIDPQMCGIGGCGAMLVHSPQAGDALIEFYGTAGSRVREDQWERIFIREAADRYGYVLEGWVNDVGYQSVAVPGTVAGLYEALTRFGSISWEEAIEPAIPLARQGFPVTGFMHGYWTTDYGPDVVPNVQRIQVTPAAKSIYTHDGALYAIGEVMVQADLARTLERLASDGPEVFYKGDIAGAIAADFAANHGFITRDDLELHIADPRFVEIPTGALADKQYAAKARQVVANGARAHDRADTTHVCVVDDGGNAVSLSHTLGSASGVVTPGLGFGYNDYM